MRALILAFLLFSQSVFSGDNYVHLETVAPDDLEMINKAFEKYLLLHGIQFGDVVGNGSGDIVGNGGGIIEGTLQSLTKNLPNYIQQTILYADFDYPRDVALALMKINNSLKNRKTPLTLEFLSGEEAKSFFFDEHDQEIRAAKTGFSDRYPIFINLDLLYSKNISTKALLTLLVHEVGHQVGYKSHSFLDILGSEVSRAIDLQMKSLDELYFDGSELYVNYLNYDMNGSKATLSLQFRDQMSHISGWDFEYFRVLCGQYFPIGFRYRNISWENYVDLMNNKKLEEASLKGILEVNCGGPRGSVIQKFAKIKIKVEVLDHKLKTQTVIE